MQAPARSSDRQSRIATLRHRATPYRGEWVIYQAPSYHYLACHEVVQMQGVRKTVEQVTLKSLAEAQSFSSYLTAHGWSKDWMTQV